MKQSILSIGFTAVPATQNLTLWAHRLYNAKRGGSGSAMVLRQGLWIMA